MKLHYIFQHRKSLREQFRFQFVALQKEVNTLVNLCIMLVEEDTDSEG